MIKSIYLDYRRFIVTEKKNSLMVLILTQGFWVCFWYRIANSIYRKLRIPILRQFALTFCVLVQKIIEIITGVCLPIKTKIGSSLYIGHFGCIIINSETEIGDNCNISQGLTIGIKHGGQHPGVPKIGNRVYIGPNVVILGGIIVGDDAAIGAGAIVTKSVPPRAIVAGNPAKVISYRGSFDYIHYDGMDSDPDRVQSYLLRNQ